TPALNALATILVVTTLAAAGIAYLLYRTYGRRASAEVSALRELPGAEGRDGRRACRATRIDQALLRSGCGRWDRRDDRGRRVLFAARPVGLRKDDDAADDRRLRATHRRADPARRDRCRLGPAT